MIRRSLSVKNRRKLTTNNKTVSKKGLPDNWYDFTDSDTLVFSSDIIRKNAIASTRQVNYQELNTGNLRPLDPHPRHASGSMHSLSLAPAKREYPY